MPHGGFTLLELTIVLVIAALGMTVAGITMSGYVQRTAAQRAAQVFVQDLRLARTTAVRTREPVVIRFFENNLWYEIETQNSGVELARRRFGTNADVDLSAATLDLAGDSLVFNRRGVADLSGAGGPLGTATFSSGAITYRVSFNGLGAAKIERI